MEELSTPKCGFSINNKKEAIQSNQRIVLYKASLNTKYCGSHTVYLERTTNEIISPSSPLGTPRQSSSFINNVQLRSYNNGTTIHIIDVQKTDLDINHVYNFNTLKKINVKEICLEETDYACDCLVFCYEYINFLNDYNIKFPFPDLFVLYNAPNLENAFWNGSYLTFGAGIQNESTAFVSSCIVGHELTHALIQASCRLEYYSQSGALNESYADVFGAMFEFYMINKVSIWPEIGDELFLYNNALRSFKEPEKYGQPSCIKNMYKGSEDHQGVHVNSGIINHLFYKMQLITNRQNIFILFLKVFFKLSSKTNFIQFKLLLLKYINDQELVDIVESIL
jgi:hypothetical protein